jgi:AAA+ superfamily predicted ATPase
MTAFPNMIKAGTEVRDADGKLFATFARDVWEGQYLEPGHFMFADGSVPQRGTPIPTPIVNFLRGLSS